MLSRELEKMLVKSDVLYKDFFSNENGSRAFCVCNAAAAAAAAAF